MPLLPAPSPVWLESLLHNAGALWTYQRQNYRHIVEGESRSDEPAGNPKDDGKNRQYDTQAPDVREGVMNGKNWIVTCVIQVSCAL